MGKSDSKAGVPAWWQLKEEVSWVPLYHLGDEEALAEGRIRWLVTECPSTAKGVPGSPLHSVKASHEGRHSSCCSTHGLQTLRGGGDRSGPGTGSWGITHW